MWGGDISQMYHTCMIVPAAGFKQTPVYVQVFQFVLAMLFHIHQSMRMSFVFQMYLQAYLLCLNISMQ